MKNSRERRFVLPSICLGTHRIDEGERSMEEVLEDAWECGYRMFDSADGYGNEERLGSAFKQMGVNRKEYFLITKLDDVYRSEKAVRDAICRSLESLKTDYIDLFLIHAPNSERMREMVNGKKGEDYWKTLNQQAYLVMEEFYKQGILREIGVSNFQAHHLKNLLETAEIVPYVNQIKTCVGSIEAQKTLYQLCEAEKIQIMGYSPLGKGNALTHPTVLLLAEKYKKTPAQILLRSLLEQHILPVVRASSVVHMKENIDIFDFHLEQQDVKLLNQIRINENWAMIKDPDSAKKFNLENFYES